MQQIVDDNELLNEMLDDLRKSDPLYQPTNYWAYYQKRFLPELRSRGLKDFRRRHGSILASFGATDLRITSQVKVPWNFRGAGGIASLINYLFEKCPLFALDLNGASSDSITRYFYYHIKEKFDRIGLSVRKCPTDQCGNPEDLVEIEEQFWSRSHLQYCSMFADAARHIPFKPDGVFCELGTGLGRNVEVMAKLYEDATFLLFDIPPQLYVANQYLQQVFGSRVLPYRQAKTLMSATGDDNPLPQIKGKIVILPTWRMPDWARTKVDTFWNSASFQEMEPDVASNYLRLVSRMKPDWIYINADPKGNIWGEWKPDRGGVKVPVQEALYVDVLKADYTLRCTYDTDYFLLPRRWRSYVFGKK